MQLNVLNNPGIARLELRGSVGWEEMYFNIGQCNKFMGRTIVYENDDVASCCCHLVVDDTQPLIKDDCCHPGLLVETIQDANFSVCRAQETPRLGTLADYQRFQLFTGHAARHKCSEAVLVQLHAVCRRPLLHVTFLRHLPIKDTSLISVEPVLWSIALDDGW